MIEGGALAKGLGPATTEKLSSAKKPARSVTRTTKSREPTCIGPGTQTSRPVLGLIDLPMLDERYVGWLGGGCRRNGTPVHVSQETVP